MSDLPETHRAALAWLKAQGGEGVIDRYGRLLAAGETYGSMETSSIWLRLVTTGHVAGAGRFRLRLTDAGRAA